MPITHAFTSGKPDGGDTSVVRPSDWNAGHIGTIEAYDAALLALSDRVAALEGGITPPPPGTRPFALPVTTDTYVVDPDIDYTGATDITAELAAWIATVPDGSIIQFQSAGTYLGYIDLWSRSNLIFDGNGATLHMHGYAQPIVRLSECAHITFQDLTLLGDNTTAGTNAAWQAGEYSAGIWNRYSTYVEVDLCTISRTWGDSVYNGSHYAYTNWCDYVWIHDSTLELNGRCAVVVDAGRNVTVEDCVIDDSFMHVFDIEPFTSTEEGATNVKFLNNTIGAYGWNTTYVSFLMALGGVAGSSVNGVMFSGNEVAGNDAGYDGKRLGLHIWSDVARRTNLTVTNNTCNRSANGTAWPGAVMYFDHVDGLTINGNTQTASEGTLIYVGTDCTGVSNT